MLLQVLLPLLYLRRCLQAPSPTSGGSFRTLRWRPLELFPLTDQLLHPFRSATPHLFHQGSPRWLLLLNTSLGGPVCGECQTPACSSFQSFATELQKVFGLPTLGPDAAGGLLNLHQGDRTVADHAVDFRTRAHESRWNTEAQCDTYLRGLKDNVKDVLVSFDLPTSLDEHLSDCPYQDAVSRESPQNHLIPHHGLYLHPAPPGGSYCFVAITHILTG